MRGRARIIDKSFRRHAAIAAGGGPRRYSPSCWHYPIGALIELRRPPLFRRTPERVDTARITFTCAAGSIDLAGIVASVTVEGLESAGRLHVPLVGWLPLVRHAASLEPPYRASSNCMPSTLCGTPESKPSTMSTMPAAKWPAAPASIDGDPAGIIPASCCKAAIGAGSPPGCADPNWVSDKDPFTLKAWIDGHSEGKGP